MNKLSMETLPAWLQLVGPIITAVFFVAIMWQTVQTLKAEIRGLKQSVEKLDGTVHQMTTGDAVSAVNATHTEEKLNQMAAEIVLLRKRMHNMTNLVMYLMPKTRGSDPELQAIVEKMHREET